MDLFLWDQKEQIKRNGELSDYDIKKNGIAKWETNADICCTCRENVKYHFL